MKNRITLSLAFFTFISSAFGSETKHSGLNKPFATLADAVPMFSLDVVDLIGQYVGPQHNKKLGECQLTELNLPPCSDLIDALSADELNEMTAVLFDYASNTQNVIWNQTENTWPELW